MAANRVLQRRQARVTVKYNRKELQRRLDVEKWIDCGLDQLYRDRVSPEPAEPAHVDQSNHFMRERSDLILELKISLIHEIKVKDPCPGSGT
uniref:Protein phosphatase 1, regulatory (inhibitor) subunit 14Ab n=1 Tax=Sphaeramia orbicularis TaxID=375764 RepID=A0A673C4H8_9TELE